MKPLLFTGILFFSIFSGYSQDLISLHFLQPELEKMRTSFFNRNSSGVLIYTDRFPAGSFLLQHFEALLSKKKVSGITKETKLNSLILSKSEKSYVKDYVKNINSTTLTDSLFENSQLIKLDTLNSILEDTSRGWAYFRMQYSSSFLHISKPIYFRKKSICLIYLLLRTGPHTFSDELLFYKKVDGYWQKWIVALDGIT